MQQWCDEHPAWRDAPDRAPVPLTVLWITPLRALANDTAHALREPVDDLGLPWTVELRTGDTSSHVKSRQRKKPPSCLVTTPESLTVLLSYADSRAWMSHLRAVVVDEWHELLSTKRGTQTELALARLRAWNPSLQVWGLSATLGNLEEARDALLGVARRDAANDEARMANDETAEPGHSLAVTRHASLAGTPALISGDTHAKRVVIETVVPPDVSRFPWHGHLGLHLLDGVLPLLERPGTTLVFTNTRSQAELWYAALLKARPDWIAEVAIHHGSLDRAVRDGVERLLDAGRLRAVVCTSSLDLGVDFRPVERVLQVGSPKGVARLMQRAGRSGHRPGVASTAIGVPAHAFELVEFAAARGAVERREIESRPPLDRPLDVLVQHLVTCAMGGGFVADELLAEARTTHAYRALSDQEWGWCLDFVVRGGASLTAYPQFCRVAAPETPTGRYTVASQKIARAHRMGIGTISSDAAVALRFGNGRVLGHVEESFVARLVPGNRFIFAGQVLELVSVRGLSAVVRRSTRKSGVVPRWGGSRTPLSTQLAHAVLDKLNEPITDDHPDPEMRAVRPLIDTQRAWSALPTRDTLLIEHTTTNEGDSWFLFPFEGRAVHEGLGSLLAYRLTQRAPLSITMTHNDYGIQLFSPDPIPLAEPDLRGLLTPDGLLPDLLACLNESQLARRQFREVARVAGLISQGFPGEHVPTRHLQASSDLFFDVFNDFDPDNLLLNQARREVLDRQLEVARLRTVLDSLHARPFALHEPARLTPLAFPLWAESLRDQTLSSEPWEQRLQNMVLVLERAAGST